MNHRRLVGIDLGIATAHTVRVLDGEGKVLAKRKAWPNVESLSELEATALAGCPEGTKLEVVMEPTGLAWLPIAVFFANRGHVVHRVSSAKASDLRKFLSRHTKTNGIDAETLARLPLLEPAGLQQLQLPNAERAALDRRVRATDRLTRLAAEHKVRIRTLVGQLFPMTPLGAWMGLADLAVLERFANPDDLLKAGIRRLTTVISKASGQQLGIERAREWTQAAKASIELYDGHGAMAFADIAAEVATEIRLLRATEAELAQHASERETCYRWVDQGELARSLPGVAEISGPALVACMGDPSRFETGKRFRSYTGLVPRTSETGDTNRKNQRMSKAGPTLLRTTLIRAADNARRQDPQLARTYYEQMVERGKNHLAAVCVVAANLAERAWAVMYRRMPYVICDNDGNPVTPEEAKAIIAERWTVTEEVRKRQRSRKSSGKAPHQVLTAHAKTDPQGVSTRRPSRPSSSLPRAV